MCFPVKGIEGFLLQKLNKKSGMVWLDYKKGTDKNNT
jgi:hypothetical protein